MNSYTVRCQDGLLKNLKADYYGVSLDGSLEFYVSHPAEEVFKEELVASFVPGHWSFCFKQDEEKIDLQSF